MMVEQRNILLITIHKTIKIKLTLGQPKIKVWPKILGNPQTTKPRNLEYQDSLLNINPCTLILRKAGINSQVVMMEILKTSGDMLAIYSIWTPRTHLIVCWSIIGENLLHQLFLITICFVGCCFLFHFLLVLFFHFLYKFLIIKLWKILEMTWTSHWTSSNLH